MFCIIRFLMMLIAGSAIYSCRDQSSVKRQLKTIDTVKQEIPVDRNGKPVSYYLARAEIEKRVGISTLKTGYNDLQIRLWYGYPFNDTAQLIVLKETDQKWSAELYTLKSNYNVSFDSILSIDKTVTYGTPSSGWPKFINSMKKLGIDTLPDYHSIPGYFLGTDEGAVTVEVATAKGYRIYSYPTPIFRQDEIWQARNMEQILVLIENEFGFKRLAEL